MKSKKGLGFGVVLLARSGCGRGPTGYSGVDGKNGTNGQDGENATPVYAVQLCPGYPSSVFPEQAICIQGKLYGVFNTQNNGLDYLSELPPRNYDSIAPSGCHLTVAPNCVVIQD